MAFVYNVRYNDITMIKQLPMLFALLRDDPRRREHSFTFTDEEGKKTTMRYTAVHRESRRWADDGRRRRRQRSQHC